MDSSVSELVYVRLSGNNPAGLERVVKMKKNDDAQTPDGAADYALSELTALIRRYENPNEPYLSVVMPMWSNEYGRYDDLARIKEWSAIGDGHEEIE